MERDINKDQNMSTKNSQGTISETVPMKEESINKLDTETVLTPVNLEDKISKPIVTKLSEEIGNQIGNSSFMQSIETGLSDLLRLVESSKVMEPTSIITFTRDIYHFYNIELIKFSAMNQAKQIFIPDGSQIIGAKEFGNYASSTYLQDGLYSGYLGIKFNDSQFPFTMSQTSPNLIENTNSLYNTTEKSLINIPGNGIGSVSENETMIQLISSLMYVLCGCISSYGNRFYIGDENISKDNRSMSGLISNIDTVEMLNDNLQISSKSKTFFSGRLDNASVSNRILSRMNGYIHNIDPDYQHNFAILSLTFPNDIIRARLTDTFRAVRPYGEATETSRSIQAVKIQSTVVTDMDQTANALISNYATFLNSHVIIPEFFMSLLNSVVVTRDDFVNGVEASMFFFSSYELVFDGYHDLTDFTFFPMSNSYRRSFEYARKIPPIIASDFASIYSMIKTKLSLFPFMLYSESMKQVSSQSVTSQFGLLPSILSTITSMTSDVSPEVISKFVAYDMMSQFVDVQVSPIRFLEGKSRPQFAIDLIGLLLEKALFPNLYKRNVHLWIGKCCEFYKMYFMREYSNMFGVYYYGYYNLDGIRILLKNLSGFSKRTAGDVFWSINMNPAPLRLSNIFRQVWLMLQLDNNNLGYDKVIRSDYRIRTRTVCLPGANFVPLDKSMSYPLSEILLQAMDVSRSYNPTLSVLPKTTTASYDTLLPYLNRACYSVGAWFHCVYCPVYLSVALHPILTCDDTLDILDSWQFFGYFDDIKTIDPLFSYSIPHRRPSIIQIPGINSIIFGDELSKQIRRLFIVARIPTADNQGMTTTTTTYDDLNLYAVLYSGANSKQMIHEYSNQLIKREQCVEVEILTSLVSTSRLPLNDSITNTIRRANLMGGVTAASFARLRDVMSKEKYNAFNLLNFSPLSNNLEDPRIYQPVLCVTSWDFSVNRIIESIGPEIIREHVLRNFRIVTEAMYGIDFGIKRMNVGVTMSTINTTNLNFMTTHKRSPVSIEISESQRMTVFSNLNYSNGYIIKGRYLDREITSTVNNANEVKNFIQRLGAYNTYSYEIVISRRFIETHGLQFLTQMINDGCSTIVINDVAIVPFFVNSGSNFANESSPITQDLVGRYVTNSRISLSHVQQTSIAQETFSQINTSIVRHVLPLNPSNPRIIFQNFHTPLHAMVDSHYFPIVIPRLIETALDRILVGDAEEIGLLSAPYGLLSSTIVYRVLPRFTIPVLHKKV